MTSTSSTASQIDFTPVSDDRLIAWYHAISDDGPQAGMTTADEMSQVKAEIMSRGLDLSPAIDRRPTSGAAQGMTGLDGQPLTDDQHRAMHHRADGTCSFDTCPIQPEDTRASLNTVWDKTIFKGEQLTDAEARAVAELALAVAGARQTAQKHQQDSTADTVKAALFDLIVEKFDARFVDDFLTGTDDEGNEDAEGGA